MEKNRIGKIASGGMICKMTYLVYLATCDHAYPVFP